MRYLANFDLDTRGELRARKGYHKNTGLSELYATVANFPLFDENNTQIKQYLMFKLLENTNNSWRELSESESLADFVSYIIGEEVIKTLLIAEHIDGTIHYYIHKFILTDAGVTPTESTGVLPFSATVKNNLMNVSHGEQFNRIFFTSNDSGLVRFDSVDDTFHYVGDFTGKTNEAYKPHGVEIRKLGFNVLGDAPLTWIDSSGLSVESIQGVYLTTTSRIPLSVVPAGTKFHINIIYTGNSPDFEFDFYDYEMPLEATATKNTTLSGVGIAVYEVEFLTQPSDEVEIRVFFSNEAVELEPYIDYYEIGEVSPNATPVEQLNVGEYKIVQMYDRLVYYKGRELWFSEVNRFDYIPNFNYITLPIDNSDEIVRIAYFRTGYIIFTRKRIYRLSGNFESTDLYLALVNDDIGCVSGNSVSLVENELYFVSNRGLRSLKSDMFRENMENIKEFDDKVHPLITDNTNSYGFVYQDQYFLMGNQRGTNKTVKFSNRDYTIPDVIRHYYKTNSYVVDFFPQNLYPRFIFVESGQLYSFMGKEVFKFGDGFTDFNKPYTLIVETAGDTLGYPMHEKKIKNIMFKMSGQAGIKSFNIDIFADGYRVHTELLEEKLSNAPLDLGSSEFRLDKLRLPTRFKNVSVRMETTSVLGINLGSIGFIFKLGKVRE